jgi:hypothetical protein
MAPKGDASLARLRYVDLRQLTAHLSILLPLIVVLVAPGLAASSRSWFFSIPQSVPVWAALFGGALVSLGVVTNIVPGNTGAAVLAATPLLQAVVFVIADRLFFVFVGRVPASFNQAKWTRRPDGRRWWSDNLFWILILFGLVMLAVFLCGHFGVEFASRR